MESSRDRDAKVLGFFGIVKSAMRIFVNPKFIAFTMIICCPLCSILSTRNLQQPTHLITEDWSTEVLKARFINNLVLFFIALTTISLASKIYSGSCAYRSMDLRHFIQNFMTCFCLPIVSSTVSEAYYLFEATLHKWSSFPVRFVLLASLVKWCEFRALMRLSFVVSMLEHKRGPFEAYSTSSNLSRGNKGRGLALILVWFFFNCGLQCLFGLVKGTSIIITQDAICIILGDCLKEVTFWLLCTLYYHDCKNRQRRVKKNKKKKRLVPHRIG